MIDDGSDKAANDKGAKRKVWTLESQSDGMIKHGWFPQKMENKKAAISKHSNLVVCTLHITTQCLEVDVSHFGGTMP